MRLEIDREPAVQDPTPEVVRQTLLRLKPSGPKWVVLDLGVNYYLQARVFDDGLFNVEYREGGPDRHYRAGSHQPESAVVSVFLDYLDNGNRWRTAFEWRRVEIEREMV